MESNVKLLFQIGFNKCATTALDRFFRKSGYKPFSTSGQVWKKRGKMPILPVNPQIHIHNNVMAGLAPLAGLEQFDCFFDMEYVRPGFAYENYLKFKAFAAYYPDAYFLLNTREKDDWIKSRVNHQEGRYLDVAGKRLGLERDEVITLWGKQWDDHHADVRSFFADGKHKFFEFHISKTQLADLIEFAKPDFILNPDRWEERRQTKAVE
jgi:hypothetical protein